MTTSRLPPAVCLMGPTAAGKTDLAVTLVEHLPMDIISVDSVMVYRGMDIGSAKPDSETLTRAPHRLIDIRDPAEAYSAAQFREDGPSSCVGYYGFTSLWFALLLPVTARPSEPVSTSSRTTSIPPTPAPPQ